MEEKAFLRFTIKRKTIFESHLTSYGALTPLSKNSLSVVTSNVNYGVIFYLRTRTVLDLVVSSQVRFRCCQIFFMSGRKPARKLLGHFRLRRRRRGENLVEPAGSASNNIFGSWSERPWVALLVKEWLKELEDASLANETEDQSTTNASRTKLLDSERCRWCRPRHFLFLASRAWGMVSKDVWRTKQS